jgi:uncharacterized oligopeptide transporter (OPT) family protein
MAEAKERIEELTKEMQALNRKMFAHSMWELCKTVGKFYAYGAIVIVGFWPLWKLAKLLY